MATVRDLITDAHKLLGVIAAGGSLRPEYAADGLTLVNRLLDAMNAERLCIATVLRTTYTWTANQSARTIGASGAQLTGPRPLWLSNAGIIPAGQTLETPLGRPMTRDEYAAIADKAATASEFSRYAYEPTFPNGTITVHPVPTTAPTLVLYVPTALATVTLNTTLSYAPGYEEAFAMRLAKRLAVLFPGTWTAELSELHAEATGRIKRANVRTERQRNDPALVRQGVEFNIDSGAYRR